MRLHVQTRPNCRKYYVVKFVIAENSHVFPGGKLCVVKHVENWRDDSAVWSFFFCVLVILRVGIPELFCPAFFGFSMFFCVIHYDPLWHKSCIYRIYIHVSADMNTQIASSIFLPHFSMLLCLVDGFIDLVFVKGLRGPTGMVCVVRKTSADHAVPCCFHHLRANKWKQQRSKSSTFNFWVSKNYWDVLTFLNKRGLDYVRKGSSLLPKLKLSDSS